MKKIEKLKLINNVIKDIQRGRVLSNGIIHYNRQARRSYKEMRRILYRESPSTQMKQILNEMPSSLINLNGKLNVLVVVIFILIPVTYALLNNREDKLLFVFFAVIAILLNCFLAMSGAKFIRSKQDQTLYALVDLSDLVKDSL